MPGRRNTCREIVSPTKPSQRVNYNPSNSHKAFTVPTEYHKQRDDETVRRLETEIASQDNRLTLMSGAICR